MSKIAIDQAASFGTYVFYRKVMHLTQEGRSLRMGARAAAILLILLEAAGELVSKEQLLSQVWPDEPVGEGNLRVQITSLRKILQDPSDKPRFIANVAGRGYRFIAPVQIFTPAANGSASKHAHRSNLPTSLTRLIGRDEDVALVANQLAARRLVTIVGPGGIGKTTVAVAVARAMLPRFGGQVRFVDLAAVASQEFVPFAVAGAVNVAIEAERPVSSLVSRLKASALLLVLDNCEHLVAVVAMVVEELLRACAGLSVLATSHEPLRLESEQVFRLAPMAVERGAESLSLSTAIATQPAVALFVEHALSSDDSVVLRDADVPHIVDICRRLDGLPLAIEIAAARVGALGSAELSARLDDRLGLLSGGRRTSASRHQTLRSLLDWSFDNLSPTEQKALRRLAVFGGEFSFESATAIAGSEGLGWAIVTESLAGLVRKSLVNMTHSGTGVAYRLLDSTRLYALEKLEAAGELERVRNLHARYLCSLLQRAETDWIHMRHAEWLALYGPWFDDVRAVIGWTFRPGGDPALGILLCTLAMPLGLQLGLVDEMRDRILAALGKASGLESSVKIQLMRLNLGCAYLSFHQNQPFASYLTKAMELADDIGVDRYRFEPLVLTAATSMVRGRYLEAEATAEQAFALASRSGDPYASLAIDRLRAQISHFVGDHAKAIGLAEQVIAYPVANIPVTYGFVATDRRVSMRVALARSLWITGRADKAVEVAEEAVALGADGGALSICQALAIAAIPLRMWRGEWDVAQRLTIELRESSERFAVPQWIEWARLFENASESRALGSSLRFRAVDPLYAQTWITVTGSEGGWAADIHERSWCAPELLRVGGEKLLLEGEGNEGLALVSRGYELARRQGAKAWELRCATSLVRHASSEADRRQHEDALRKLVDELTEGSETMDVRSALALLSHQGGRGSPTHVKDGPGTGVAA